MQAPYIYHHPPHYSWNEFWFVNLNGEVFPVPFEDLHMVEAAIMAGILGPGKVSQSTFLEPYFLSMLHVLPARGISKHGFREYFRIAFNGTHGMPLTTTASPIVFSGGMYSMPSCNMNVFWQAYLSQLRIWSRDFKGETRPVEAAFMAGNVGPGKLSQAPFLPPSKLPEARPVEAAFMAGNVGPGKLSQAPILPPSKLPEAPPRKKFKSVEVDSAFCAKEGRNGTLLEGSNSNHVSQKEEEVEEMEEEEGEEEEEEEEEGEGEGEEEEEGGGGGEESSD